MGQTLIQGCLQIPEKSKLYLPFIRDHVTSTAEPQRKKQFGNEHVEFWAVEFTATWEQWHALEPELKKWNITANLYEAPQLSARVQAAEERKLKEIDEKNRRQAVWVLGYVIFFVGIVAVILGNYALGFSMIFLGLVIRAIGLTLLQKLRERVWR